MVLSFRVPLLPMPSCELCLLPLPPTISGMVSVLQHRCRSLVGAVTLIGDKALKRAFHAGKWFLMKGFLTSFQSASVQTSHTNEKG